MLALVITMTFIGGICVGYLVGFERGIVFKDTGNVIPISMPPLRSFSRKEKRRPKSVSEFDQWKKEQGRPPDDPA